MKRIFKQKSQLIAMLFVGLMIGCSSDDTSIFENPDPDPNPDPVTLESTIIFNELDPSLNKVTATAMGEAGGRVPGIISFTTEGKTQRRLYVTQNIAGQGDMPFSDFFDFDADDLGVDVKGLLKADGSIDIDGTTKSAINFTFDLPVPDSVDDGEIVYSFWTTTGKGDFRDPSKRLKLGVGTITVSVGTGTNPAASLREFTGIRLAAPAADGTSPSFFSSLNSTVYKISEGTEFAAFWDFGYFHLDSTGANLASTRDYNPAVVDVPTTSGTPSEELNQTYFELAAADNFATVTMSGELDNLSVSTTSSQTISNLAVGDVVEFIDQYGKKGLIKVTAIVPGFSPATNYIDIDIKVQP